jgi:bacteriorhodopsin
MQNTGYSVISIFLIVIFALYLNHRMNQVAKNTATKAAADKHAAEDPIWSTHPTAF